MASKVKFEPKGDVHQVTITLGDHEVTIGKQGYETDDGSEIAALDDTPTLKRGSGSGKDK